MIVVADTSPINYLVLLGCADVLPRLFGHIIIPSAVARELEHVASPTLVKHWINAPPSWVSIQTPHRIDMTLDLDDGEREAIALAEELHADAILLDEQKARRYAVTRGSLSRAHLVSSNSQQPKGSLMNEMRCELSAKPISSLMRM